MLSLLVFFQNFVIDASDRLKNESKGATAVEYGLLVGLIAVAIITLVATLGDNLAAFFTTVNTEMSGAGTTTTTA